jgi:hypothetical protein
VGEILLIAAGWRLRALVRAQLLEEGYSVRALPTIESALAVLIQSGEQPRLAILDTQGLMIDAERISDLWQVTGQAPLILCGGVWNRGSLSQGDLPPARVLLRPFCVGDLVEQAKRVLICPESRDRAS